MPITEPEEVERYHALIRPMMRDEIHREYEFSAKWIRDHRWKVVPVEEGGRFNPEQRNAIISALSTAGFTECLAIATESLGEMPTCYRVPIDESGFQDFNRECGIFRFVLTDEKRSWAISCNEWYNLYAGEPELVEAMLGKSIEQARSEFFEFALLLAKPPDDALVQVAQRYAEL